MAAAAAACPGGPGEQSGVSFVYENRTSSSPKVYVLQPWIVNLLVNYEQLDTTENLLAGQVLRVLSDSSPPDQPGVLQDAVLHISDGSYYIRVVISSEALKAEEKWVPHMRLSSLVCRVIVLQKYTVCFQEEARLEDCEFYLTAQQFIVLPMERQRLESPNGNQEPLVLEKIKELWLRSLALKNAPSSEPSISQLIDAIGENKLEVLQENAEECLDLGVAKETPAAGNNEVPITPWEAERKKEEGEIFVVAAHRLVMAPEEEVAPCEASKEGTSEAAPGQSNGNRTVQGDLSTICQASPVESTALSESSEGSLDNPWNWLPPISLTLNSSDEKTSGDDLSQKTQQNVAADSNTPDLLEACSQDSPKGVLQGEALQTSPSLLLSYSNTSQVETDTPWVVGDDPAPSQGPQVPEDPQASLPSCSPAFPILPSSHRPAQPGLMPLREQADSSGSAFPPDTSKRGLARARTQGGDAVGTKRKLLADDDGQQHPRGAPWGRERDTGKRPQLLSTWGRKKSRKECEEDLEEEEEEEEQASPSSGPSSRPEQCRTLKPYVKEKPPQYRYEAPSPELCQRVQSVRISKAMLKWACWILTERSGDS
ncbi:adrenocortical dysplasia protein homolog isoform X2 [Heliangelus exortis]|uniref:adrenocortical dysplasia protein homolog isoform X2 n=1 Tax=Heliangelus exortis TaxID=472823 RepID=UPI003A8CA42E